MMYRTFAASILAAITMARGTGDGSSKENASEVKLIDTDKIATTLYTYNERIGYHDELRVEVKWETKPGQVSENSLEYGFCV